MKIVPAQILCFISIVCNLLLEAYCTSGEHILTLELVTPVTGVSLGGEPQDTLVFYMPEDRQKLCFYAAIKANLPWVDYSYVPYWLKNLVYGDRHYYGMLCKGLRDFYLLRETFKDNVQIRIVRSRFDHYEFDDSRIIVVESAEPRDDLSDELNNTVYAEMEPEDRKNLCALALQQTKEPIFVVNGDVEKAQPYDFKFEGKTETDIAILCPTSPKLYLSRWESSNEMKLYLFKSGIDEYDFEKDDFEATAVSQASKEKKPVIIADNFIRLNADDRMKLCTLARQWNGVTTLDTDRNVTKAQVYTFQYSGKQKEEHNFAILCPVLPPLYLRLVDENKIKLTFIQLEPQFYVSGIEIEYFLYRKPKKDRTPEDEKKLSEHLFTNLDDEARWRICHIAQKYILRPENRVNFRFTKAEDVLLPFKTLLTPNARYIDKTDLRVICHDIGSRDGIKDRDGSQNRNGTKGRPYDESEDITYMCTTWPEMYIRLGTSENEIKIILLKGELSNE